MRVFPDQLIFKHWEDKSFKKGGEKIYQFYGLSVNQNWNKGETKRWGKAKKWVFNKFL